MSEIKLKNCPFCGGEARLASEEHGAAVCSRCKRAFFMPEDEWCYCPNCGSVMNLMETGEDLESLVWRKREEKEQ